MKVFSSVPRIISGPGCIDALGDEVRRMAFGESIENLPVHKAALLSVKAIKRLLNDLNISFRLADYGVKEKHFHEIAKAALSAGQLISNNLRQVTEQDVVNILKANM